jgi:hypothetical protein
VKSWWPVIANVHHAIKCFFLSHQPDQSLEGKGLLALGSNSVDGGGHRLVPGVGVAHSQQEFGVGKGLHDLPSEKTSYGYVSLLQTSHKNTLFSTLWKN